MNNVDTTKTITHISLCSGYGGIDIGLARAIPNLRTICFSEIEAFACANLVSKMEKGLLDTAPIWTDLKTFPWGKFRGAVDLLSGGFPCQPFSAAGKRNADTDERHLFPYILQGIRECQPRIVFLENVEGIISAKLSGDGWSDPAGTPVLLHVLRELERVGYKSTAGIFSASEVGAPHQRKRVFIMGYAKEHGIQRQRTSKLTKSFSYDGKGLPCSTGETMVNTNSNGGREVREICQGTNGSVIECNGEERRIELANSKDIRCTGRNTNNGVDRDRLQVIEEGKQSMVWGETQGCRGDSRKAMANSSNNTNTTEGLCQEGSLQAEHRQEVCARFVGGTNATIWPSRPGQPQYWWEPPRVVANTRHNTSERWSTLGQVQEGHGCTETESQGSRSKRQRKESESVCSSPESQVGNTSSLRLECSREQGGLAEEGRRTKGKRSKSTSASKESSHTSIGETTINEIKSELGLHIDGNSSILGETINYNISENIQQKIRAREILFALWNEVNSQKIQWSPRGLQSILAEEVLQSGLCLDSFTERVCYFVWCIQTGNQIKGWGLQDMWVYKTSRSPSQGSEPIEQFKRELGYSMCQLSYEIALGRRKEAVETESIMQGVLQSSQRAWILSEAPTEMEEVWKSTLDQKVWEKGCYNDATSIGSRNDELRLLGNGVVPQTCTKAFIILFDKLMNEGKIKEEQGVLNL